MATVEGIHDLEGSQKSPHIDELDQTESSDEGDDLVGGIGDAEGSQNIPKRHIILGGIQDVKGGENSPEIDSLARFAVSEYNKKQNVVLELKKVVKAKEQLVSGMLYYITLEASDGKVYEAKVWKKAGRDAGKEVTEFKLIGDAPSHPSA